ncbi:prepilin peptidase [Halomicroarcula sp. F13]|uniref:Prepilin peptidase n=1 Tax=Haloarcula rubra TaxID=2487747 RepID=A0AAW4PPA2_9EURY|nr:A24 family peptidase [Halomicroarcula rubra]MBX0322395.1 prepilin peptidase [Halomicroarcula rubra]
MLGSIPDLLRLLAVPVFGWAAYRDVKTRRVPNRAWVPLAALAVVLLLWDSYAVLTGPTAGRAFLLRVAISLGFVAPLAYGFWLIGGFGGADAKAFMLVAVLFPVYPVYYLPTAALPLEPSAIGVFSLTILSNTVLAGVVYPLGVAVTNLARGRFSLAMFIGKPVAVEQVPEEYGRLLETTDGFTRSGLDVDALRMYLQWRGATLAEVRADPDAHRDPDSLPRVPNDPGDGSIATDGGVSTDAPEFGTAATADPWGAERFLDDIEGSAYGTSPEQLREGLEVLVSEDEVWISPGIPFLVPMFAGLVVSLVYGDVLYALLGLVGVA